MVRTLLLSSVVALGLSGACLASGDCGGGSASAGGPCVDEEIFVDDTIVPQVPGRDNTGSQMGNGATAAEPTPIGDDAEPVTVFDDYGDEYKLVP